MDTGDGGALARAVEHAVEHFNAGDYHAALGELEDAYHGSGKSEMYLGLIRLAAALYHFERGQPLSARRLYRSAREILGRHAPVAAGVDLEALLAEADPVMAPLLAAAGEPPADLRPASRPQIRIRAGS